MGFAGFAKITGIALFARLIRGPGHAKIILTGHLTARFVPARLITTGVGAARFIPA